jgi:hypothetical protein
MGRYNLTKSFTDITETFSFLTFREALLFAKMEFFVVPVLGKNLTREPDVVAKKFPIQY